MNHFMLFFFCKKWLPFRSIEPTPSTLFRINSTTAVQNGIMAKNAQLPSTQGKTFFLNYFIMAMNKLKGVAAGPVKKALR
jgi:hypothetical protein